MVDQTDQYIEEYDDDDIRKPNGSRTFFEKIKNFDYKNFDYSKLKKRKALLTIFSSIAAFITFVLILHFSVSSSKAKSAKGNAFEANKSAQANIESASDFVDLDFNGTIFPTNEYTELYSGTGTGTFAPSSFNETETFAPTVPWWQGQRTWAPTVWSSAWTSTDAPEEEEEAVEEDPEEDEETEEAAAAAQAAQEEAAQEAAEAEAQEAAIAAAAKAAAEAEAAGADKAAVEEAAQEAAEKKREEAVASLPLRVERKREPAAESAESAEAAAAAAAAEAAAVPTQAPVNPWMFGTTYAPSSVTESPTWVPTATWAPTATFSPTILFPTWMPTMMDGAVESVPLPSPAPTIAPIAPTPAPTHAPIEELDAEGEDEFENSVARARASYQD